MGFTKVTVERPRYVQDTLSGKFVASGKQKTAEVLVGKGWGGDAAAKSANAARKVKIREGMAARSKQRAADAETSAAMKEVGLRSPGTPRAMHSEHEHYQRAWRKFTNLQERSNSGRKISPMRSRSFTPIESALPEYGGRTGSNWEFNGNKRVRKAAEVGKRMMSDTELKRRKKLQAGIAVTTSTLGLTALGLKGGAAVAGRSAKKFAQLSAESNARGLRNHHLLSSELHQRRSDKLNNAAMNTSLTAGGIGGLGGYNFASYTRAEGKKRQVKKNWSTGMDFGLGNVQQGEHVEISKLSMPKIPGTWAKAKTATTTSSAFARKPIMTTNRTGIKTPFNNPSKTKVTQAGGLMSVAHTRGSLTPLGKVTAGAAGTGVVTGSAYSAGKKHFSKNVTKAYDPERNRQKRLDHYQQATMFGAGGLGTGAVIQGRKAIGYKTTKQVKGGTLTTRTGLRATHDLATFKGGLKGAGKAGALGLGAAGLAVGSSRIKSYKKGRGRSHTPMHTIGY